MRPRARLPLGRRLGLFAGCTWLLGGVALAQQPAAGLSPTREPVFSVRLFQAIDREDRPAATPLPGAAYGDVTRTGLRAEIQRTYDTARSSLAIGGAAQASHVPARGLWLADDEWVAARAQVRLSRLASLTLSQRASYADTYTPQAANTAQSVASNALIDVADVAVRGLRSFTTSSSASLSRTLSRRSSLLVGYDFNRTAYAGGGAVIGNHRIGAAVGRTLARNWSLQAGYESAWATTAARDVTSAYRHQVDVRTVYRLPFWRGTTVSADLAPGVLGARSDGPSLPGAAGTAGGASFALQGGAGVDHAFGSASRIGFAYQRTASFLPGAARPTLANVVTARGAAELHRRVTAQFSVSSSRGTLSLRSLSAWARTDVRLSPAASLYAEYSYDSRADSRGAAVLPGLDRNYAYRSLRVGVNVDFGLSGLPRRKV